MPMISAITVPRTAICNDVTMVRRKAEMSQMLANQRRLRPCGGKVR